MDQILHLAAPEEDNKEEEVVVVEEEEEEKKEEEEEEEEDLEVNAFLSSYSFGERAGKNPPSCTTMCRHDNLWGRGCLGQRRRRRRRRWWWWTRRILNNERTKRM